MFHCLRIYRLLIGVAVHYAPQLVNVPTVDRSVHGGCSLYGLLIGVVHGGCSLCFTVY